MNSEAGELGETETLTREEGERLANAVRGKPDPLKAKKIPPSLLSAEHVREYVMATGLISPFHEGGKKKRLKKASYEGKIGEKAYKFENGGLVRVPFFEGCLRVEANSITFVECNLDFRLPEYIGLRFNLQIRHVHRGLLLGTGPLIDPGYWGKLCIPLHNLTSKDYLIPLTEGLIWIEFTKTTSNLKNPSEAIGVNPGTQGFWHIEDFIMKASRHFMDEGSSPIQSSIPESVSEANKNSKDAIEQAGRTKSDVRRLEGIGVIAILGLLIACGAILFSAFSAMQAQIAMSKSYVDDARKSLEDIAKKDKEIDGLKLQLGELQSAIRGLSSRYNRQDSNDRPDPLQSPTGRQ